MLRVLTLATLFPNAAQPNHGVFVAQQTLRLAARADVDLRVVAPVGLPPLGLSHVLRRYAALDDLPERELWQGVRVERPRFALLPAIGGPFNPGAIARAVAPVLARLKRDGFDFDVIDAEFFYPEGPAAMRLARRFKVPFSVKARGADIHYWGKRPGCGAQVRQAAKTAAGLLAVAQSLKRDMGALGIDEAKVRVHYTGVDLSRFKVGADRPPTSAPTIVSVGALIPRKGHDLVIDAVAHLPDARLLIAGTGPERAALEEAARTSGVAERVRFLGDVAHGDIPALLGQADVMALASSSEGLANAWVEALACGTPIVIPDVDGAREVIDRPEAGRLVERTPQAIAAAIREIAAAPPPRAAVRAVAERFTWERNTQTLFEHLSACAGRG